MQANMEWPNLYLRGPRQSYHTNGGNTGKPSLVPCHGFVTNCDERLIIETWVRCFSNSAKNQEKLVRNLELWIWTTWLTRIRFVSALCHPSRDHITWQCNAGPGGGSAQRGDPARQRWWRRRDSIRPSRLRRAWPKNFGICETFSMTTVNLINFSLLVGLLHILFITTVDGPDRSRQVTQSQFAINSQNEKSWLVFNWTGKKIAADTSNLWNTRMLISGK